MNGDDVMKRKIMLLNQEMRDVEYDAASKMFKCPKCGKKIKAFEFNPKKKQHEAKMDISCCGIHYLGFPEEEK